MNSWSVPDVVTDPETSATPKWWDANKAAVPLIEIESFCGVARLASRFCKTQSKGLSIETIVIEKSRFDTAGAVGGGAFGTTVNIPGGLDGAVGGLLPSQLLSTRHPTSRGATPARESDCVICCLRESGRELRHHEPVGA